MSWGVNLVGTPEAIAAELNAQSERENGQSKVEFDAALPHLLGVLSQNFAVDGGGYPPSTFHLEASGSGTTKAGEQVYRSMTVSLKYLSGKFVAVMVALLLLGGDAFAGVRDHLRERRGEKPASSCGSCTATAKHTVAGTTHVAPKSGSPTYTAPQTYSLPTAASGCANGNCPAQAAKRPTWLR